MADVKILGLTVFDLCDKMTANFLMTFGSLLFTLFVGWRMKKSDVYDEFTNGGSLRASVKVFGFVYFLIKFVAPVVIGVIFITTLVM